MASTPTPKERLLNTAAELFYERGTHLGVNELVDRSGVARMTLYNHFSSKQALIEAALELRAERWRAWFRRAVEDRTDDPTERLLAVFDALEERFDTPEFRGCAAINFAAEAADSDSATHRIALDHKEKVRDYLTELAQEANAHDPDALGRELSLLLNGATVMAQLTNDAEPARQAKSAARVLIETAIPSDDDL